MTKVLYWISDNWWLLSIALAALVSILNAASRHWSEHAGLKRALLFVAEVLSILTSAGASTGAGPGAAARLKWPLTSVPPRARERKSAIIVGPRGGSSVGGLSGVLVLLLALGGCAGWQAQTKTALSLAGTTVREAETKGLAYYARRCMEVAKACPAGSGEDKSCTSLQTCHTSLRQFRTVLDAADLALLAAWNALAAAEQTTAAGRLAVALRAVGELSALLAGIVPGVTP